MNEKLKKSEMYKYAQCAVVDSPNLCTLTKLDILRELMASEDLALFCEKQEEENNKVVEHETV
jgi:hypothetical protein